LVITGTGRAFSAGGDVKSWHAQHVGDAKEGRSADIVRPHRILRALRQFDKPVIAAINGVAAGAGFEIATHCDFRIAADTARFKEAALGVGLVPGEGSVYSLTRLVGLPKALELILLEPMINAQEAERIGLVNKIVPPDQLAEAVRELATQLAQKAPIALRLTKRAIYKGIKEDLDSVLDFLAMAVAYTRNTEDHREGARAFVEKRAPVFKGQ